MDLARSPVSPGEILAGKYRVDRILGAGAMGVVVAAHHVQLDDQVAIKFMLPGALEDTQAVARFAREARAAAKIKSEHVVRVMDVGTLESGAPYMVMEYLPGKDLGAFLTEQVRLRTEVAVDFVLQAAEAIAEAHSHGIVHRDLKPANLFVLPRPEGGHLVKVLDFGISKMSGKDTSSDMTHTSVVMGSPFYMSPEQLRSSRSVDARSDIWALGVILYELVVGGPPFDGDTMPELVHRTVSEPPPAFRDVLEEAPPGLEEVILKCLAKDPSARYQTIRELAVALVPFAPERSKVSLERISGFSRAPGAVPSSEAAPPTRDPSRQASPASAGSLPAQSAPLVAGDATRAATASSWSHTTPRSRGKTTAGIALAAIVLAAGSWLLLGRSSEESAPALSANPALPPPVEPAVPAQPEGILTSEVPVPSPPAVDSAPAPAPASAPPHAVTRAPKARQPPPAGNAKPGSRSTVSPGKVPAPAAASSLAPAKTARPSIDLLIDDRK